MTTQRVRWVLLLSACSGTIGEAPGVTPPPEPPPPIAQCTGSEPTAAGPTSLMRLTASEYSNAVLDLVGATVSEETIVPDLRFDSQVSKLTNAYYSGEIVSVASAEQWLTLPGRVVPARLAALKAQCPTSGRACASHLIDSIGNRAVRGRMDEDLRNALLALYDSAASEGEDEALSLTLQALLAAPDFLFRLDAVRETGQQDLDAPSLAERLALFLWQSVPDQALLDEATSGRLLEASVLESQARRMVGDPKFDRTLRAFTAQWLRVDEASGASREGANAAQLQSLEDSFYAQVAAFARNKTYRELLTSSDYLVNEQNASYFGAEVTGSTYTERTFAERAGILNHPAWLSAVAHNDSGDPIHRGHLIFERLLCDNLPDAPTLPPACGSPEALAHPEVECVQAASGPTERDRLRHQETHGLCRTCHNAMNPLGYAFGVFDQLGRHRLTENDARIDTTGTTTIDGQIVSFADSRELLSRIAASQQGRTCFQQQVYRFALKRFETASERCAMRSSVQVRDDATVADYFVAAATSPSFRTRMMRSTP